MGIWRMGGPRPYIPHIYIVYHPRRYPSMIYMCGISAWNALLLLSIYSANPSYIYGYMVSIYRKALTYKKDMFLYLKKSKDLKEGIYTDILKELPNSP